MPAIVQSTGTSSKSKGSKRPHPDAETIIPASSTNITPASQKKQRVGPSTSSIPRTLPMHPHEDILGELQKKYKVLDTSVISSSKIEKKVSSILAHLGRFDFVDLAVLPGIMMLHARASDTGKMTSVIELVKRRIGESHQPWYQYNRLYEVSSEGRPKQQPSQTVIEETVLGENEDDGEDDDFEMMDTPFERALREKPVAETMPYMSIFLSRIPVPELQAKSYITIQSNVDEIGRYRRSQFPG